MRWQPSANAGPAARPDSPARSCLSRDRKPFGATGSLATRASRSRKNQGVESLQPKGGLAMGFHAPAVLATPQPTAELDRLGDEIAELSAHLDAATGRLLALIREFDARGGWNTGFRSCAEWLGWRAGLDIGASRERVRVARALGALPLLSAALARGELSYAKVRALTRVATPEIEAVSSRSGVGDGRPRRAHRARLAAGRLSGRGAGGRPSARRPRAPGL
jgi:hypothetical protein